MKFGNKLKLLRSMRSLDQDAMSKLLQVSQPVYSRYERNEKEVKEEDPFLERVSEVFGVSGEWLKSEDNTTTIVYENGSIASGATGTGIIGNVENYYAVPKEFMDAHIRQQELMEKLLEKLMST